uniref:Uncharacterized protein n=1 Tax=Brassica oleracea TaxID=3712 RepID=A0A3P6HAJ1_BRAOL|nr:unnamed protein product [Brassica oleracea]
MDKSVTRTKSNSPNGSEGRDRPQKKAKTNGSEGRPIGPSEVVAKPFQWQHFKLVGCPLPSLRNMTERDAYMKMAVAHAKVSWLGFRDRLFLS